MTQAQHAAHGHSRDPTGPQANNSRWLGHIGLDSRRRKLLEHLDTNVWSGEDLLDAEYRVCDGMNTSAYMTTTCYPAPGVTSAHPSSTTLTPWAVRWI